MMIRCERDDGSHDVADLSAWPLGERGTVCCVAADTAQAVTRRLAELGLRRGAHVTVVQKTPGGGRVVAIGDARLALDRTTLRALRVTAGPE